MQIATSGPRLSLSTLRDILKPSPNFDLRLCGHNAVSQECPWNSIFGGA